MPRALSTLIRLASRSRWPIAVVVGAAVATCMTAHSTSPDGSSDVATDTGADGNSECPTGQRLFNGACRTVCTTSANCTNGEQCTSAGTGSVCLPLTNCAYLGSDTECVGIGHYTIYTRFGMESVPYASDPSNANPADATPYMDSTFVPSDANPYLSDVGCQGNGQWLTVPASTDPACGQTHAVTRCRRLYNACRLVSGTTIDQPAP